MKEAGQKTGPKTGKVAVIEVVIKVVVIKVVIKEVVIVNQEASHPRSERRDAAENRRRILEAAQKLFDTYGVEQVSMNQIASEAQVGPGTLYRRYSNKSELCLDLIKDNIALFFTEIDTYLEQNRTALPEQRLRGTIKLFLQFREKKAQLLAGVEEISPADSLRSLPGPPFNKIHRYFVTLFDEINAAEQTHYNSVFRADMLLAVFNKTSYTFQREVRGYSLEFILEQVCDIFLPH